MADISKAGFCARGAKRFFDDRDLDFRSFLKNGIDADTLLATGDARAIKTVERKVEREMLDADLGELVLTIDDLRDSRKCHAGTRTWAQRLGLDWNRFLDEGIPAGELLATGDAQAISMIRDKLERARG